ncbi:unnamed protein product [Adineta ricciae]|uniref:Uncharacterized protein n=1 Tax=Adineta ricciae TaxID=249248 RepID=A0A815G617_ADIRI|nr:unnamed protein product [Adineta ricciae]
MTNSTLRVDPSSILILLAPNDTLHGFDRPDFFHEHFFLHCLAPAQCKEIIEYYANFKGEIDIFLPHHAIVMVNIYASPTNVRRRFYLYCDTDGFVTEYKRYQRSKLCEQVFHINELEDRLYKKAHKHIFNYLTLLQARAEDGDIDAEDLKLPVSELLLASAEKINDIIRQTAGLPEQPVEII